MNKLHDPELELFKRTVDLADYAKRAGYEPRPQDGAPGLTVLDHPNRDRIVVGQSPSGPSIYASVPDYALRAPGEPAAEALARLRGAINRSQDKGTVVEFVQRRPWIARDIDDSIERARERIRAFTAERRRDVDHAPPSLAAGERAGTGAASELGRRRYDWSPPVDGGPQETDVERRLRQWREAQAAIERRQRHAPEVPPPSPPPPQTSTPTRAPGRPTPERPPIDRGATVSSPGKSELGRRRYDWAPAPPGLDALVRGPRGPSGGRER